MIHFFYIFVELRRENLVNYDLFAKSTLLFAHILLQDKCIYIFSPFFEIRDLLTVSTSVIRTFIDEVPLEFKR
jgi:hypothetical protein